MKQEQQKTTMQIFSIVIMIKSKQAISVKI